MMMAPGMMMSASMGGGGQVGSARPAGHLVIAPLPAAVEACRTTAAAAAAAASVCWPLTTSTGLVLVMVHAENMDPRAARMALVTSWLPLNTSAGLQGGISAREMADEMAKLEDLLNEKNRATAELKVRTLPLAQGKNTASSSR